MPAYAYPVTINRERETVRYDESREIEGSSLTLADLQFVGDDCFSVHEREFGGYIISVSRSRAETDEEMAARIARGEAYMAEYNRRNHNLSHE